MVIDEEWQITPICEMLSIDDSFESYDFALNFIFDLEPYTWMKFRVIFYDSGINSSILPQIVLLQKWCHVFWDHWILDINNWRKYFGVSIF